MTENGVFISYSQEDAQIAEQIEEMLKEMGLSASRDRGDFYHQEQWPKAIGEAISANQLLLVLWSKNAHSSQLVEFELTTALALDKMIVPCLLDETPLIPVLSARSTVEVSGLRDTIPKVISGLGEAVRPANIGETQEVLEKLESIPVADIERMARSGTHLLRDLPKPQVEVSVKEPPAKPVSNMAETVVLSVGPQIEEQIGERYKVRRLLGQGGMGAVYHVYDTALDRDVALKIIRPEIAENPEFLERFKREIQLSSIVTHKNVLRVYDLGGGDGFKFLTMQYVQGENLSGLLRREGKLPLQRLIRLFLQICKGLKAAHEQDVLHRDLKPDNVLVDSEDRVYLTDFGLAKSTQHSSMTQAGQVMGTPDYMSPEQVKGEPVDQRSDIYSLGALLYEMVAGRVPYTGNSVYEVMIQRVQKPPKDAKEFNPDTPDFLANIVSRSMAIEKEARYGSVDELLDELNRGAETLGTAHEESFQKSQKALALAASSGVAAPSSAQSGFSSLPGTPSAVEWIRQAPVTRKSWYLGGIAFVVILVFGAWLYQSMNRSGVGEPTGEVLSLAIIPFRNDSGDVSLEWLSAGLAEMLRTRIGQSADVRIVSSDRIHQILGDLRVSPQTSLHEGTLRRIAEYCNADRLIWGSYAKVGSEIQVEAAIENLQQQTSMSLNGGLFSEEMVPEAVTRVAEEIRESLSLSSGQSEELEARSFIPTAGSGEALRLYYEGLEATHAGDNSAAVGRFEEAVVADPEFALAHAKLGMAYGGLGLDLKATTQGQEALTRSERLSGIEQMWVRAIAEQLSGSLGSEIEAYERLAELTPADPEINFALGDLYEIRGDFELAQNHYRMMRQADPKNMNVHLASGRVEIKMGSPESSLEFLNQALSLAVQVDDEKAKADTMQALGIAYKLLDRREDALRHYEDSLEIRQKIRDSRGVAASLSEIAQIYELMGKLDVSREKYSDSLEIFREIGDRHGEGVALMNIGVVAEAQGDVEEALRYSTEALQVQMELEDEENQSLTLNNIGSLYFSQHQYEDAFTYFERALELRERLKLEGEIADSLHNLGETYHRLGQYENARTQFQKAFDLRQQSDDRRGAALETYGMGSVYLAQGRYGAALSSLQEAVERLRELEGDDAFLAEVSAAHGDSLSQVGRMEEAEPILQEAFQISSRLKNPLLVSSALTFQGKNAYREGDVQQARTWVQQALTTSKSSGDLHGEMLALVFLAKLDLRPGNSNLGPRLRQLAEQTEAAGFRQLSAECSVYSADLLVGLKRFQEAQRQLEQLLRGKEDFLSKDLQARLHLLLGTALRGLDQAEAARTYFARAKALLEEVDRESNSGRFLQRADIQPLYQQVVQALAG